MKKRIPTAVVVIVIIVLVFTCRKGKSSSADTAVQEETSVSFTGPVYDDGEYKAGSLSIDADEVDEVSVIWNVGDVEVNGASDAMISASESGSDTLEEKAGLHWRVKDRRLEIMVSASGYSGEVKPSDKALTVSLPEGLSLKLTPGTGKAYVKYVTLTSIDVTASDGRTEIYSVTVPDVNISSSAGPVRINYLEGVNLSLKSVSGDIAVTDAVMEGDTVGRSSSGYVKFFDSELGTVSIETEEGDIGFRNSSATSFEYSTVSGNLDATGSEADLVSGRNTRGETYFGKLRSSLVIAESESGRMRFEEFSPSVFDIENGKGKVYLDFSALPEEGSVRTADGSIFISGITEEDYTLMCSSLSGEILSPLEYEENGGECIFGSGNAVITVETQSGDIEINQD